MFPFTYSKSFRKASLILLFSICYPAVYAQVTEETYHKAEYFLSGNLQKEIYHLEVIPHWIKGQNAFWHQTYTENGKRFFITDVDAQQTQEAFDHSLLAELLSEKSGLESTADALPFNSIQIESNELITFEWSNQKWKFNSAEKSLSKEKIQERPERNYALSPDGKWKAFTRNFNLFVENLETGEETQLSFDGKKDYEYASFWGWSDMIHGENGERPYHFTARWSPDSKYLQTQIVDLRLAEKMYLLDFSQDSKFRPELLSYYRGSPGDSTVVNYTPVLFEIESKEETKFPSLTLPHFIGMYFNWSPDSKSLNGTYIQRGFKSFSILEIDAASKAIRKVYAETSPTHINTNNILRRLENGQFVLGTEKSGWNHLYRYDWNTGELVNQITSGEYQVNNIITIDEENEVIYFEANGKENSGNPYYSKVYKVNFDGSGLVLLTPENAFHSVSFSEGKEYFIDNYSTVDQPTTSVVRELETGKILFEVSKADISNLLERGYQSPKQFTATAKDGKTKIYGIYYLPTDFDSGRHYPVVDYTYSGPHTAITPKTFKAGLFGLQQPMAELGFVVVTVDGLGTSGRGKAFRDVSYNNLGNGTTDHVLAIKELASKNNFLDIDRVGIFGHSAGGYDAGRAMLLHPDFYKVGVASAGDHDHRMEKAWWPEMYMGYPSGEFYHNQSNVTSAANLKGHLLLAHGGIDENVNPSATYKLAEALINAGKDFDLFIWPSRNHSFGRTNGDYFTKKRWDYFIEHLLGEKPLRHYQIQNGD
ncbi:DPP IV N-terminal domain-containing protein [Algoriphagus halophytocola]|uniref:DPP IV N-terminal domain-containing protein n=1 Tax=Algoriphagus halophytocola TaxID=2991499 RepID=A0ABY6MK40_9BACT|nr:MULTISPECIES: DPP IV N-terminal domain-containing protein [unclassified Algoriphagus]UZD23324.1 DPP IV N-terminal domain-containing protein [Algoriphagus sp. TR-M5]WBL44619.1 DPP IV N-terminal domain-containing protein [Algoriphagus sp. TR-M9]